MHVFDDYSQILKIIAKFWWSYDHSQILMIIAKFWWSFPNFDDHFQVLMIIAKCKLLFQKCLNFQLSVWSFCRKTLEKSTLPYVSEGTTWTSDFPIPIMVLLTWVSTRSVKRRIILSVYDKYLFIKS